MESDAPFRWPEDIVVMDSVALEGFQGAVIHSERDGDLE